MKSENKIYFEKYGQGGEILLCIHGFGASHLSFKNIGKLIGEKYTLYALDLIGFGKSNVSHEFEYTINEQAMCVFQFLKEKNISNYSFLGHSYGGGVLLKLLLTEEFLGFPVKPNKIILISPLAYNEELPFFIKVLTNPLLNFINRKLIPTKFQARIILKFLFYDNSKITCEVIKSYALYYRSKKNTKALTGTAKKLKLGDGKEMFENYKSIFNTILIIYGKQDRLISERNILNLSKNLNDCKVRYIHDCGHIPHEEKSCDVKKIILNYD